MIEIEQQLLILTQYAKQYGALAEERSHFDEDTSIYKAMTVQLADIDLSIYAIKKELIKAATSIAQTER